MTDFLGTDWHEKIFTGTWTAGSSETYDVIEPATGETLGRLGAASGDDVNAAATRAAAAQKEWAKTTPAERAAVLRRAGALWAEHADELAGWIIREAGSIPPKAALEISSAEAICYESSALPSHPKGQVLTSNEPRWSFARRVPAGVVSVIAPFNFPLILAMRSVAPALALGNAVLLKPDPRTAVCAGVAIAKVFAEAGLPEGLLQVLPGGLDAGEAVVAAPRGLRHLLHRLHRGRTQGRRSRRSPPQTLPPRTRRQQCARRPARCRGRSGHLGGSLRIVDAPGPDLHDHRPPPRPRIHL